MAESISPVSFTQSSAGNTANRGVSATINAAAETASILARLRSETRLEHAAIESALSLTSKSLTLDSYRRTLERFYGYYRPLEAAIFDTGDSCDWRDLLDGRRKTPLVEFDLMTLGIAAPESLPQCHQLPVIDSAASAFGGLYVMEGATLGGQFISRHIKEVIGMTAENGGRFFHGYGERTSPMWQAFRTKLEAFATSQETQDELLMTATQTFRTLREWFTQGKTE